MQRNERQHCLCLARAYTCFHVPILPALHFSNYCRNAAFDETVATNVRKVNAKEEIRQRTTGNVEELTAVVVRSRRRGTPHRSRQNTLHLTSLDGTSHAVAKVNGHLGALFAAIVGERRRHSVPRRYMYNHPARFLPHTLGKSLLLRPIVSTSGKREG